MRRAVLLLVMATGCRQIFGLDGVKVDDAAPIDTDSADAHAGTCIQHWQAGPRFGTPVPIVAVNTGASAERLPFVVADGSRMYFVRDNEVYSAGSDMAGGFLTPVREADLSSGGTEGRPFVNHDQTRAFFSSNRPSGSGGAIDLWRGFRADSAAPWSVDQMYLDNLNAAGDQANPHLEGSLLHIYYTQKDSGIVYAERDDTSMSFGLARELDELHRDGAEDDAPTLPNGELVIVFASKADTQWELYYATRADPLAPFSAPLIVPDVNVSTRNDDSPYITPDGCKLYFASDRMISYDIYVATLLD